MSSAIGSVDLIVLVVAVGCSIALGLYLSGKNTSVEAYLLGDRSLPWWAILGSIVATETSTATVLSVPGRSMARPACGFCKWPRAIFAVAGS
ncbi:MAG: hypothetical protein R3C56_41275 [Pirellulaceae bacterium]